MSMKVIQVRVDFSGADAERIERVRRYRGVKAYSELVRLLVAEQDNNIQKKDK